MLHCRFVGNPTQPLRIISASVALMLLLELTSHVHSSQLRRSRPVCSTKTALATQRPLPHGWPQVRQALPAAVPGCQGDRLCAGTAEPAGDGEGVDVPEAVDARAAETGVRNGVAVP